MPGLKKYAGLLLALMVFVSASLEGAEARGVRNNNPGNIRSDRVERWPGAIGVDEQGYLKFRRPVDGLRAIVINLEAYRDKHKLRTCYGIIRRWTRGESRAAQERYAYWMAQRFNYTMPNIHERLDMWDAGVLAELARGIVQWECGYEPYPWKFYRQVFPGLPEDWR